MKKSESIKVTLRYDWSKDGKRQNLYLHIYPAVIDHETRKMTRRKVLGKAVEPLLNKKGEFQIAKTGIIAVPETTPPSLTGKIGKISEATKAMMKSGTVFFKYSNADEETIKTAMIIRDEFSVQHRKMEILGDDGKERLEQKKKQKSDPIPYFKSIADTKNYSMKKTLYFTIGHFQRYIENKRKTEISFKDLDEDFCIGFRDFLTNTGNLYKTNGRNAAGKKLAINTAAKYWFCFCGLLKEAYKHGYLAKQLFLKKIEPQPTHREFVTLTELRKLAETECEDYTMKRAALFSALTGLRWSDIEKMVWKEVSKDKTGHPVLNFTIKKTKKEVIELPISSEALSLCGKRGEDSEKVFAGLQRQGKCRTIFKEWIKASGIERHITFHCFRHTFATLQLASGTDITTVQEFLGHKSLATTQIYAKVLDEAKKKAVDNPALSIL